MTQEAVQAASHEISSEITARDYPPRLANIQETTSHAEFLSADAPPQPAPSDLRPADGASTRTALQPERSARTREMSAFGSAFHSLASSHFASLLGTLFWPSIFLLLLISAWHPLIGADDVWAHAAIGSWIWDRGEVPRESLFLWGAPPIAWVWHSWLSQLSFYGLMRGGEFFHEDGGPYAIATFTMLGVAFCFVLLWRLWRRNAPTGTAFALMFFAAVFAGVLRYRPRPELFTAIFLVLLMLWLDAWWRQTKTPHASTRGLVFRAVALCALFALWSNFHGAVLLGLILLFATAICDVVQNRADKNSRYLCAIALACAASTLLNPFGAGVLLDSFSSANSGMFARIDEWKPPLIEPLLWRAIWCEIILVTLATIGWWFNPHRRLAHAAWLLLFFAMFLMQRRHLWLLALVCLGVGAMNAHFLNCGAVWNFWCRVSRQEESAPPSALRVLWRSALLVLLVSSVGATLRSAGLHKLPVRATGDVPVGAASFVESRKLPGRIFNDYENSSYLQWAWNGNNPLPREESARVVGQARRALYIDLLNSYPPALLEEYLVLWGGGAEAQKLLDKRNIKIVVLGDDKRDASFTKWLNANRKWRRVYDKRGAGLVWVRAAQATSTPPHENKLRPETQGRRHIG